MLSVSSHAEKWGKKALFCSSSAHLSASLSEFGWVTPWLCVSAPSSHSRVLLHACFWSELQLLAETSTATEALCCVSASSLVLVGSSEEMGDPGQSSSAGKLPPQEQCLNATQNSHTCLVSPASLSLSFSKIIRAIPMKNVLVNGVGFSIISSQ